MRVSTGFTLIELLVVITIIAVLAAILFPVFAKTREKARQSSCQSNLRQLAMADLMYMQDHDETTCPYADHGCSTGDSCHQWWEMLAPYTKNSQVLLCPDANPHDVSDYAIDHTHVAGCGSGNRLATLRYPAETCLFLDGQRSSANTAGYYIAYCRLCDPTGMGDDRDWNGIAADRHGDGSNCAFVDGHGKWTTRSFLLDPTPDITHMKFWWHTPNAIP